MAKEKLKLSLDQEGDGAAVLTADEAGDFAEMIGNAAKEAEAAKDNKKEGRVTLTLDDKRITVAVTKVKIEKEEDDER